MSFHPAPLQPPAFISLHICLLLSQVIFSVFITANSETHFFSTFVLHPQQLIEDPILKVLLGSIVALSNFNQGRYLYMTIFLMIPGGIRYNSRNNPEARNEKNVREEQRIYVWCESFAYYLNKVYGRQDSA